MGYHIYSARMVFTDIQPVAYYIGVKNIFPNHFAFIYALEHLNVWRRQRCCCCCCCHRSSENPKWLLKLNLNVTAWKRMTEMRNENKKFESRNEAIGNFVS